jgi:hypothetical protein
MSTQTYISFLPPFDCSFSSQQIIDALILYCLFILLGIEPTVSQMLSKSSNDELYS